MLICDRDLVGNKMVVNALVIFLWVTRWLVMHGYILVGNKMDDNAW